MPPCRDGVLKTPILANTSKSLLAPMQSADPISWCSDSLQASLLGALGHCRLNIQSSHHWLPFLKKGSPLATAGASTEARPQNPKHRPPWLFSAIKRQARPRARPEPPPLPVAASAPLPRRSPQPCLPPPPPRQLPWPPPPPPRSSGPPCSLAETPAPPREIRSSGRSPTRRRRLPTAGPLGRGAKPAPPSPGGVA